MRSRFIELKNITKPIKTNNNLARVSSITTLLDPKGGQSKNKTVPQPTLVIRTSDSHSTHSVLIFWRKCDIQSCVAICRGNIRSLVVHGWLSRLNPSKTAKIARTRVRAIGRRPPYDRLRDLDCNRNWWRGVNHSIVGTRTLSCKTHLL